MPMSEVRELIRAEHAIALKRIRQFHDHHTSAVSFLHRSLATRAQGPHPFPFRTRPLSPAAPMVLRPRGRGRVGRRRHSLEVPDHLRWSGASSFPARQSRLVISMPRAGIVTVAGKPNAGKSTLLNRIIGQKLAIVSPKPQSTRDRIVGIHTDGDVQMIVFDTPGLLNPKYALQRVMRATALAALRDADVIVYLTDASDGPPEPLQIAASLDTAPAARIITALNKADLLNARRRDALSAAIPDALFISAATGEG